MKQTRRTFIYARVSTAHQSEGTSLQDQQAACAAHAKARGLTMTKAFVEAETGVGERAERRVQMQALLKELRQGDLVLCYALDRWSRDIIFTHTTMRDLKARGVSVFFIADHLDPMTDAGEMQLGYMAVGAQAEHARIKRRLVGTRRTLVENGFYAFGHVPFGYKRKYPKGYTGPDRVEKNILQVDEKAAALVRRIFQMCAGGMSIAQITKKLDGHPALVMPLHGRAYSGLRDLVVDTIHKRVYLGEVRDHTGQWVKGKHDPIVSPALFVKANEALSARRLGGPRPHGAPSRTDNWILRDVACCGRCGARMSAAYAGKQLDGSYSRIYYKCSAKCVSSLDKKKPRANRGVHVPVTPVERQASPYVNGHLVTLIKQLQTPPAEVDLTPPKSLEQRRAALVAKRERTIELYTDGTITKDAMAAKVAKVDADLLKLEAERPTPSPLADDATRRRALTTLKGIVTAWKRAAPPRRRKIINLLAEAAFLAKDRPNEVRFKWRPVEDLVIADVAAALAN